jgi:hypothetical protein
MFQIEANEEECFYDKVKSGTKMGLIFEVAEGGALDIDVKIEGIDFLEFVLTVVIKIS